MWLIFYRRKNHNIDGVKLLNFQWTDLEIIEVFRNIWKNSVLKQSISLKSRRKTSAIRWTTPTRSSESKWLKNRSRLTDQFSRCWPASTVSFSHIHWQRKKNQSEIFYSNFRLPNLGWWRSCYHRIRRLCEETRTGTQSRRNYRTIYGHRPARNLRWRQTQVFFSLTKILLQIYYSSLYYLPLTMDHRSGEYFLPRTCQSTNAKKLDSN